MKGAELGVRFALAAALCTSAAPASELGDAAAEAAVKVLLDGAIQMSAALTEMAFRSASRSASLPTSYDELDEWKDPETGSTSRMKSACGVTVETALTGNGGYHFVEIAALSETTSPAEVRIERLVARPGPPLRIGKNGDAGSLLVEPGALLRPLRRGREA